MTMMNRRFGIAALALLFTFTGCASSDETVGQAQQDVGGASVSTDSTAYSIGGNIVATFTTTSGTPTDWIALAKPSDPPGVYEAWSYTDGSTAGTLTFTAPSLAAGTYEARLFYNWAGTQSTTVQATSAPFTVGSSISTDHASYSTTDTIIVSYAGLPGNAKDWVAVAPAGSPNTTYTAWSYTAGATSGTAQFSGLSPGTYVARTFVNDTYTLVAESASFAVSGGSPVVATSQGAYSATDSIVVNYSGLTADPTDWISLAPAGSPYTSYPYWQYTSGAASGTLTFAPIPSGSYEVRAFFHDSFTLAASATFTVGGNPAVATDHATYTAGQAVAVTFSNLPGNQTDWVAVSVAGSPATSYVQWGYTNGATSGTSSFAGLPPGSYEARAYSNNSYTIIASSTFSITAGGGATVSTNAASYTTSDTVTVTYAGLTADATDWVGISVAGSPADSYVAYVYTSGQTSGTATFSGLPAGTYEARTYLSNSYQEAAVSSTFVVQ